MKASQIKWCTTWHVASVYQVYMEAPSVVEEIASDGLLRSKLVTKPLVKVFLGILSMYKVCHVQAVCKWSHTPPSSLWSIYKLSCAGGHQQRSVRHTAVTSTVWAASKIPCWILDQFMKTMGTYVARCATLGQRKLPALQVKRSWSLLQPIIMSPFAKAYINVGVQFWANWYSFINWPSTEFTSCCPSFVWPSWVCDAYSPS